MKTQSLVLFKSAMSVASLAVAIGIWAALPLAADNPAPGKADQHDGHHDQNSPARLVQLVRDATRQFANVNNATAAGYHPFLGCVSGPDHGAMGQHYVKDALVADGKIDASLPEALIYEVSQGRMQLVGVEFIVDAATWLAAHQNTTPVLEGQTFQYVSSPNRFASAAFFELHVWAWRDNPNGAFVDWNNEVSCEDQ